MHMADLKPAVFVVFTSTAATHTALEKADGIAKFIGSGIALLAIQTIPYPLPMDGSTLPVEFLLDRFDTMAGGHPEMRMFICLCRDRLQALKSILSYNSPVVFGISKRIWPTREEKLARKLHRAGYAVIMADAA